MMEKDNSKISDKLDYYNENIKSIIEIQRWFRNIIRKNAIYNDKQLTEKQMHKLKSGEEARAKWGKKITMDDLHLKIQTFNSDICNGRFKEIANIVLDLSENRQSTLKVVVKDTKLWNTKKEFIYIITLNDFIMKIGGTRDGMKGRWSSYGCGYYVSQRKKKNGENYPGKMSVTNAYLYHTIEASLIHNKKNIWKFYVWDLPIITHEVNILGEETTVISQTFHAYESVCINKYKKTVGKLPLLCDNCDPNYT